MDQMRISNNKVVSKVENVDPKVQKQAKAKRDGVILYAKF